MHPATIEFIERCGEIFKNFGAAFVRWAVRVKSEPAPTAISTAAITDEEAGEILEKATKNSRGRAAIVHAVKND